MPMSRQDAADFLKSELSGPLADAGIGTEDMAGELKGAIDRALQMTGTAYGDLPTAIVADADAFGFQCVLLWAGLKRIATEYVTRVNVSMGDPGISKAEGQLPANVTALLDQAWIDAEPFVTTGSDSSWQAPISMGLGTYERCWR